MPISSSRNRLTANVGQPDEEDDRSGAKSVPVLNTSNQQGNKQTRSVVTPSPSLASGGRFAKTPDGTAREQEKVKLPFITRIQNSLFGRSRSHDSTVASIDNQQPRNTPRHSRYRRKKHKSRSAEFSLRKIRFFTEPPVLSPLTICFAYPGVDLNHHDIVNAIQSMHTVGIDDIESIQFVDMNVILGTAGINNRWLIKVKDFDTRYLLLCDGLKINGEYVIIRKYDDLNMEDYKEYQRRKDTLASDEHNAVQRLLHNM
ncbi:uncharacterized protein LOC117302083 [Asterias rubens]|uniref:uncharacterized protein LOC117302083 n=1 Tax=Asterias rubens TaxID=7604 RepID=UPI0014554496|nr:uncharacterized protein LOC117302083 [Asterias rubens]